jgi:hypothetical protein
MYPSYSTIGILRGEQINNEGEKLVNHFNGHRYTLNIIIIFALCIYLGIPSVLKAKEVQIITEAHSLQQQAEILKKYLEEMYSNHSFDISITMRGDKDAIVLKLDSNIKDEAFRAIPKKLKGGRVVLTISGGSQSGIYYAVFKLLEELGCGFFLSYEKVRGKTDEIKLENIHFSDKPLAKRRVVFNWHNFLSGCSSWDLQEWKHYIDQASKMRFNGLMTHFYANDPSFVFSHNGVEKRVGFMPNTQMGRQYGTQQVNDVRRLVSGEIFDSPVFGSETSKVPEHVRVEEARKLVQNIHHYAASKFMDVWFGYDIDYQIANPQEIMATLPASAKIKVKMKPNKYIGMPDSVFYLPVPDSPEGKSYYQSQVVQLFDHFPEIDNLVLWTRTSGSAFLTLRYDKFPETWKEEFDNLAFGNKKYDKTDENITGRFATSKVYETIRACLDELGKKDVKLWAGSWRVSWLEHANWFYPDGVGFIPLDYHMDYFSDPVKIQVLKDVSMNRDILPVVWAHHDDGAYIGSPSKPYENLHSNIESAGNTGVGIIHWKTKPLDIYFKNTEFQVWERTNNYSLKNSAEFIASRLVSPENKETLSNYLENWVEEGPKFGRETRTWFIDHQIQEEEFQRIVKGCQNRIQLLGAINEDDNSYIQYFRKLEEFCISFYQTQYHYQNALQDIKDGHYGAARGLMRKCTPESVIEKYTAAAKTNGITKGEKGVVVEMNLSWLPFIISMKQTVGQVNVMYNFGKVNFPDLGIGLLNTNYVMDSKGKLWRNYGRSETGGGVFSNPMPVIEPENPEYTEICASGVVSLDSLVIHIKPIAADISPRRLKSPDYFVPGNYLLTLVFTEHEFSKSGERVFEIKVKTKRDEMEEISEIVDIVKFTGSKNKIFTKTIPVTFETQNSLILTIENITGGCLINGLVFEPVHNN